MTEWGSGRSGDGVGWWAEVETEWGGGRSGDGVWWWAVTVWSGGSVGGVGWGAVGCGRVDEWMERRKVEEWVIGKVKERESE